MNTKLTYRYTKGFRMVRMETVCLIMQGTLTAGEIQAIWRATYGKHILPTQLGLPFPGYSEGTTLFVPGASPFVALDSPNFFATEEPANTTMTAAGFLVAMQAAHAAGWDVAAASKQLGIPAAPAAEKAAARAPRSRQDTADRPERLPEGLEPADVTHVALLTQGGQGCGYSIGCGFTWVFLSAESDEEAWEQLKAEQDEGEGNSVLSYAGSEDALEECVLLRIDRMQLMDLDAFYKAQRREDNARREENLKKHEVEELKRLAEKYPGALTGGE